MPTFRRTVDLDVDPSELFAWHARPGAFDRLAPPWERIEVLAREGGIEDGGRLVMRIRKGPLRVTWEALHRDFIRGVQFVDEQVRGPFARWTHTHRMSALGPGRSQLEDRVDYALPMGWLGRLLAGRATRRTLERMFTYRHRQTTLDLERHRMSRSQDSLRVAISGASGMVGSALSAFLRTGGHEVVPLVRSDAQGGVRWDPREGEIDAGALEGVDAVIHLAGAPVADKRWSDARKALIRDSRVDGTRVLSEALAGLAQKPRVLISASAIGYYGDAGADEVDEGSPPGEGFLADVCRDWEAATAAAEAAGIRVVHLRIGVVLSPRGGALGKLLLPFRLGVGGRIGRGKQWMSWIALDDLVGILHALLYADEVEGPVNAVAPNPVTNREFTRTLGRVLRRPTILPVPAFAIRAAFGAMGEETILASARVAPRRLVETGFDFRHPDLEGALRHALGRA